MKVRKKPTLADAEQWFPDKCVVGVIYPILNNGGNPAGGYIEQGLLMNNTTSICTMISPAVGYVNPGDWIITDIDGDRVICTPNEFEEQYEAVEE